MVERLKEEYNVDLEWRPFYLYFDTPPEGRELSEHIKRARANGSEERLASIARSYGMEFRSTERIYNTRIAHEATEYAREHGMGNEFHKIVFRKVYADGQDPSNWDVLRSAAEEVGLNADEMQRDVESERYKINVEEQVKWAYQNTNRTDAIPDRSDIPLSTSRPHPGRHNTTVRCNQRRWLT